MVTSRLIEPLAGTQGKLAGRRLESEAQKLARVLPRLALEARQVSAQVALGIHGRRRAGPGESFWQFRPFTSGEPTDRIDWRRSARDDRLYVREREWESASTYWIWIDCSASMGFMSSLALAPKRDRAIVLGLAMADLLVRGGERVGLLGLSNPISSRHVIGRFSEILLAEQDKYQSDMPAALAPGPRDRVLLFGDFIVEADAFTQGLKGLTSRGATGVAVQIRDPVETLFPYFGETEFEGLEDDGRWLVGNAQDVAEKYRNRIAAHQEALRLACLQRGWTFQPHNTNHTANEGVLALAMLLQHGSASMRGG